MFREIFKNIAIEFNLGFCRVVQQDHYVCSIAKKASMKIHKHRNWIQNASSHKEVDYVQCHGQNCEVHMKEEEEEEKNHLFLVTYHSGSSLLSCLGENIAYSIRMFPPYLSLHLKHSSHFQYSKTETLFREIPVYFCWMMKI